MNNAISNRTTYDTTTGVRTTQPENIDGNWNANVGFGVNAPLDKKKSLSFDLSTDWTISHSVSYLDGSQFGTDRSTTKDLNVDTYLSLEYRNDWLNVGLNGNLTYSHSKNNVLNDSKLNTYSFSYGTEVGIHTPWGTTLNTDLSMNSRRGYAMSSMNTKRTALELTGWHIPSCVVVR